MSLRDIQRPHEPEMISAIASRAIYSGRNAATIRFSGPTFPLNLSKLCRLKTRTPELTLRLELKMHLSPEWSEGRL